MVFTPNHVQDGSGRLASWALSKQREFGMKTLFKFLNDESGATAIEYGLIAALIAVGIIGVLTAVGGELQTTFTSVQTGLAGATP